MEQLQEFARRLENFVPVHGPSLEINVPIPASVQLYLENLKLQFKNDLNQVMKKLECASSHENDKLLKKKKCNKKPQSKKEQTVNNNKRKMLKNNNSYYTKYISFEDFKKGLANNELFEGIIHINNTFISNAYVTLLDKSKDVLISSIKLRNRALDGDKVVVKLLDKSKWLSPDTEDCQRTGEVVYITNKKYEKHVFVGRIITKTVGLLEFSTLVPRDKRLPKLRINTSDWPLPIKYTKATIKKKERPVFVRHITAKRRGVLKSRTLALRDKLLPKLCLSTSNSQLPIKYKEVTKKSLQTFYALLKNWNINKNPTGELIGVAHISRKLNDEINVLPEHKVQKEPYPENIN